MSNGLYVLAWGDFEIGVFQALDLADAQRLAKGWFVAPLRGLPSFARQLATSQTCSVRPDRSAEVELYQSEFDAAVERGQAPGALPLILLRPLPD
ncbi:hypothetical protein [Aestuariivirga sp.]|uniref:hypothetical protein n=1 Tax=Aestuariivirga sp. TaxID=2650926 RepID=UPI0039196824